ncbi:hypothetical protein G3480_25100 [Thiorhodococcus mannitoliphagus]|uniref:Cytochrome c domain-containing protein n=1 Tax=Thiorhodococcus mannitoliphagus TaxID=329406 RepID=A0A6P1E0T8_9GAMM|nr:hypothetical protein [Thiorhodococcus mannitoliphagus]NEX23519.1 hypothetical protein [Thiorhodococcus mannitoliphagus]
MMHRILIATLLVLLYMGGLIGTTLFTTPDAKATPAFARQVGLACAACHNQNFPALNSFGRSFKAGGYTMVGTQALIEGDHLSLPSVLNASLIGKFRYAKTNGNTDQGTDRGQIQWPDEAALLIGGRAAKNVGFLFEIGLAGIAVNGVADDSAEVEGGDVPVSGSGVSLLGSKIQFNVAEFGSTRLSLIPFSTDGLGAGYGFELLNTGAVRNIRPIEYRSGFSASQALNTGAGGATGMAFVVSNPQYFINYTPWTPGFNGENFDVELGGLSNYLRAAYTSSFGSWDTALGFQLWNGSAKPAGIEGEETLKTDAWVIDAQALGTVRDLPLSLYASYGQADGNADSLWGYTQGNASSFAIMGQLGVLPNRLNLYLAFRTLDNGQATDNTFNAYTLGGNFLLAQNIRLELYHVIETGSGVDARENEQDSLTMLQLFVGF